MSLQYRAPWLFTPTQSNLRHKPEKDDEEVCFCDFGQRQLFRWLDLPAPINPDKVTASVDQGILQVIADKVVDSANKVKAIAAS